MDAMSARYPGPDELLQALEALRQSLLEAEETGRAAEETVELDQTRVGRLSRMDALQAQAMSVETGRRRRLKLQQIDAALGRIESGRYGECLRCGENIGVGRLEIDLVATLCISCAAMQET